MSDILQPQLAYIHILDTIIIHTERLFICLFMINSTVVYEKGLWFVTIFSKFVEIGLCYSDNKIC